MTPSIDSQHQLVIQATPGIDSAPRALRACCWACSRMNIMDVLHASHRLTRGGTPRIDSQHQLPALTHDLGLTQRQLRAAGSQRHVGEPLTCVDSHLRLAALTASIDGIDLQHLTHPWAPGINSPLRLTALTHSVNTQHRLAAHPHPKDSQRRHATSTRSINSQQ